MLNIPQLKNNYWTKLLSRLVILFSAYFFGCSGSDPKIDTVKWSMVETIDIAEINSDLENGKPTIDVGVYFPSNLDPSFKKVTLEQVIDGFISAKEIYKPTSVQLSLLFVKTGNIDERFLSIQANKIPGIPRTEYVNMYEHMKRNPSALTDEASMAFESFIEPSPDNHRTVYLVVLQDVFFPFLEVSEGRNWMIKTVRTGGLSFPTYSYVNSIPLKHRGVISLTNLSRPDRLRRTIAHEIGHKAMNVSHEYLGMNPEHEIYAEGGLMIYGKGEEIPSGKSGRWHLERLLISPFVYKQKLNERKIWNPDYMEGGHYYDPIYKEYVVKFEGSKVIDENW